MKCHLVVLITCLFLWTFSGPAAAADARFCGYRNVDAIYAVGGVVKGTSEECYRKYCTFYCILEKTETDLGIVKQKTHKQTCVNKDSVWNTDHITGKATVMPNPMRRAWEEGGNITEVMLGSLNIRKTGKKCASAGVGGAEWKGELATACIGNNFLLSQETSFAGMGSTKKTATSIDPNPKSVCEVSKRKFEKVTMGAAPSTGNAGQQQIDLEKLFGNMPNNIPQDSSASTASEQSIKEGAGEASIKSSASAGDANADTTEKKKKKFGFKKLKEALGNIIPNE